MTPPNVLKLQLKVCKTALFISSPLRYKPVFLSNQFRNHESPKSPPFPTQTHHLIHCHVLLISLFLWDISSPFIPHILNSYSYNFFPDLQQLALNYRFLLNSNLLRIPLKIRLCYALSNFLFVFSINHLLAWLISPSKSGLFLFNLQSCVL